MTILEARKILEIPDGSLTPEIVKTAYRRMVMTTHPDKGGSVQLFLQVQAAYELLLAFGGQTTGDSEIWSETPTELAQRLDEIEKAFQNIVENFFDFTNKKIESFDRRLFENIKILDSKKAIQNQWSSIVEESWNDFSGSILWHLDEKILAIGKVFDHWLTGEMKESIRKAKDNFLKTFWRKTPFVVICSFLFVVSGLGAYYGPFIWLDMTLLNKIICILLLGLFCFFVTALCFRQYAEKKYDENVQLPRLAAQFANINRSYFIYRLDGIATKDESSSAGAVAGGSIGFAIGGPLGLIVGATLGGVAGWLFGTPIETIQKKVYFDTCARLEPHLKKFCEDKIVQLENLKRDYLKTARDNFEKASRKAVLLLMGK